MSNVMADMIATGKTDPINLKKRSSRFADIYEFDG